MQADMEEWGEIAVSKLMRKQKNGESWRAIAVSGVLSGVDSRCGCQAIWRLTVRPFQIVRTGIDPIPTQ